MAAAENTVLEPSRTCRESGVALTTSGTTERWKGKLVKTWKGVVTRTTYSPEAVKGMLVNASVERVAPGINWPSFHHVMLPGAGSGGSRAASSRSVPTAT